MTEGTQHRLKVLERGTGRIDTMSRQITDLSTALAEICKGQLSQDEAISDLRRRVQQLEAERGVRAETRMSIECQRRQFSTIDE
jgi:hypothetical protein